MRILTLYNKDEDKIIIEFSFNPIDNNSLKCNITDTLMDDFRHLFKLSSVRHEGGLAERLEYPGPKFGHF